MKRFLLIIGLLINVFSVESQEYNNYKNHFSFNYSNNLSRLSEIRITEINDAQYNKQLGLNFETGFENIIENQPPLILVYILKNTSPSDFNSIVKSLTYNDINISNTINSFNEIMPLINNAKISKPLIDLENKIIIFSGEMDLKIWPYQSIGKGLFVQFFGKENIVQINFATTIDEFDQNLSNYFLPIISSFSFNYGYNYVETNKVTQSVTNSSFGNPVSEFLNGYTSKFESNGSGKGLGLKLSIRYPQSWKSDDGNRPHIVRKFSNNDKSVQAILIVNDLGEILTKTEINDLCNEGFAKQMVPNGGYYLKSNRTVIDGEQAMVLDYSFQREKLGALFKGRTRAYSIFYKSYLLQVQFTIGQIPFDTTTDLNKSFEEYEMLFNAMINSLIIISKWEN